MRATMPKRKPLRGGVYSASEALELLNSHYLIGKSEQEVATFRIRNDGRWRTRRRSSSSSTLLISSYEGPVAQPSQPKSSGRKSKPK